MDLKRSEDTAREMIKSLYGTPEGEDGPTLFVSHHLEELDAAYWVREFGTSTPEASTILNGLVLVNAWSSQEDGNIDVFDFSLPNGVSDYLLSVRFEDGKVTEVEMES